jgi:hypothetical protein
MKAKNKKARTKLTDAETDLSKPVKFSLLDLGGPNDPCFGTHDPQDNECKQCGDSEFCQIIKAQNNHKLRAKEESKSKFKDKDKEEHPELDEKALTKFIKQKMKKGYEEKKVKRLAVKKFTPYISKFLVETKIESEYEKVK